MRIHYLQHVPFEDLANIEIWAKDRSHGLSRTLLFQEESPPGLDEFDWLIIMGGPMNIYEHYKYPWLAKEKEFIRQAIEGDKIVIGICLGAQLISDVLGGKVSRNDHREIGWFPVKLTDDGARSKIFGILPENFMAIHWHGDTFDIPPGAMRTAESAGCRNQAFIKEKAIGLQFHLESSMDSVNHLIQNCADEITEGKFVQGPKELQSHSDRFPQLQALMERFLDNIEKHLA